MIWDCWVVSHASLKHTFHRVSTLGDRFFEIEGCSDSDRHVVGPEILKDLGKDPLIGISARTLDPDSPDTE